MDDTMTADASPPAQPPPAPPPLAPRRLERSKTDRMFQGVCGGVAAYLGVDATVVRVGFVVLSILGGVGIVAYGAAWLLVPEEGEPTPTKRTPWEIAGIVLLAIAFFGVLDVWDGGPTFPLLLVVVGAALVWGGRDEQPAGSVQAPPPSASPVVEQRGEGRWSWSPPTAPVVPDPPQPPPGGPHRRHTGRALAVASGGLLLATGAITGAIALSGSVSPTVTLGLSLAAFGALMAIGSFWGWSRPLAFGALTVVLALAATIYVDVPIEGGIGERVVRPARPDELPGDPERLAVGSLELDLTGLGPEELTGRSVDASVALGELLVTVPEGVTVEVRGEVGAGLAEVFGVEEDGTSVEVDQLDEAGGELLGEPLVLELEVGVGHLEVQRGG